MTGRVNAEVHERTRAGELYEFVNFAGNERECAGTLTDCRSFAGESSALSSSEVAPEELIACRGEGENHFRILLISSAEIKSRSILFASWIRVA